ncbi:MAG: COR domain-containing protein [Chitinophagales bacterium]|nr:COR domain-containing protein [Chitinophagales bacterium]
MPSTTPDYALQLIHKAAEEKANFLDLANCGLTAIPPEITKLAGHLESLHLGGWYKIEHGKYIKSTNSGKSNDFSEDSAGFEHLQAIAKLTTLSVELCNLSQTALTAIGGLSQVTSLNVSNNIIGNSGAESISRLSKLTSLDISNCAIKDAGAESLSKLIKLTSLKIGWNQLGDAGAESLSKLSQLTNLDISSNQLGDAGAESLSKLSQLTYLNISENQIGADGVESLINLKKLNTLFINNNIIEDQAIRTLILRLKNLKAVDFRECHAKTIPPEILNDVKSLRAYFKSRLVTSNCVKMILTGNTEAGKTTLAQWLAERNYEKDKESTHGIKHWVWKPQGTPLKVNIWDFGGQDYFHATHELFLDKESLFLYLKASQETISEEGQGLKDEYWIGYIASRCDKQSTPLWYVQTKSDLANGKRIWCDTALQDTFPVEAQYHVAIKQVHTAISPYLEEFQYFEQQLTGRLQQLASAEIPISWAAIRDAHLPRWREEHLLLPLVDFKTACEKALETNEELANDLASSWDGLVTYLKGCGELVHFEEISSLQDKLFLGPEKLTKVLYEILSKEVRNKRQGRFDQAYLNEIKDGPLLIDVLLAYDLIFKHGEEYVAPQYLPEEPRTKQFERLMTLSYAIRFPFYMSRSLISQFIITYAPQDPEAFYWRYGIFFKHPIWQAHCFVRIDADLQIIYVHVEDKKDKYSAMKELFDFFMDTQFGKNNKGKHKPEEETKHVEDWRSHENALGCTLLSNDGKHFASAKAIIEAMESKAYRVKADETHEYVSISPTFYQLLDTHSIRPKRIFFSYSKADAKYLAELDTHLSALKRSGLVETWKDVDLLGGEPWDAKIKEELDRADVVILLLSPDFMATEYVWQEEIPRAIQAGKTIVPIFLRPCDWDESKYEINSFAALPPKGEWIVSNERPYRDESYLKVAKDIRRLLEKQSLTESTETENNGSTT